MPENATISDDEKDSKNNYSTTIWDNNSEKNKGILDVDFSGVSNVDLSTPLGEDEKFPQMTIYSSPEEVRRKEEDRSRKLLEEKRARIAEEAARLKGEHVQADFGTQIRTVTVHPYTIVKDHRTNYEMGDTTGYLGGNVDPFIRAYLQEKAGGVIA